MHELLLQSSVPAHRHTQVLTILARLAAMTPQPVLEQHYVFKPNRSPSSLTTGRAGQVGAAQDVDVGKSQQQMAAAMAGGDLYYLKVVREDVSEVESEARYKKAGVDGDGKMELDIGNENGHSSNDQHAITHSPSRKRIPKYTMQFRDLPEATRQRDRAVTNRFMADVPIASGDPWAFMKAFDYSFISTYQQEGHRLTHNNTSLLLYRILLPTNPAGRASGPEEQDVFDRAKTKLLDPSGNYVLQATVRVQDGSKVEIMTKAVSELLALKETLKGVVDLDMAERLSLDTRVR